MKRALFLLIVFTCTFSISVCLAASDTYIESLEKKAAQGDAIAQFRLGVMYERGDGVTQDYIKAKEWFQIVCDKGHKAGCERYEKLDRQGY